MAQPDLLGILDAEHQNLGVYYGLGEKSPSLCTKSRFPSPTFLAVKLWQIDIGTIRHNRSVLE